MRDSELRITLTNYVNNMLKGEKLNPSAKKALMLYVDNKENRGELAKVLEKLVVSRVEVDENNFALFYELLFIGLLKVNDNKDEYFTGFVFSKKLPLIYKSTSEGDFSLVEQINKKDKLFPIFKNGVFWTSYVDFLIKEEFDCEQGDDDGTVTSAILGTIQLMKKLNTSRVFRISKLSGIVNSMIKGVFN